MKYIITALLLVLSLNSYSQIKLQKLEIESHLVLDSIKLLNYNCILEELESLKENNLRLVNKYYDLNIKVATLKKDYVLSKTLEIDKKSTIIKLNASYKELFFNRWFTFYKKLKLEVLKKYEEEDLKINLKLKQTSDLQEKLKMSDKLYENDLKRIQLDKEEDLLKIVKDYELLKNCCNSLLITLKQ
jgi:hypothetical protein